MKKWTKAIAAVAAGAMLIPLAACGSTRGGSGSSGAKDASDVNIGISCLSRCLSVGRSTAII